MLPFTSASQHREGSNPLVTCQLPYQTVLCWPRSTRRLMHHIIPPLWVVKSLKEVRIQFIYKMFLRNYSEPVHLAVPVNLRPQKRTTVHCEVVQMTTKHRSIRPVRQNQAVV